MSLVTLSGPNAMGITFSLAYQAPGTSGESSACAPATGRALGSMTVLRLVKLGTGG
jgi:hypothetical protein